MEKTQSYDREQNYAYYNEYGGNYFGLFCSRNPEFATKQFSEFVASRNRGDRDSGELHDIAKHEVLRLAYEFAEWRWRFPNVYGTNDEGFAT